MAKIKTLLVTLIFLQICYCKVWKNVGKTLKFLRDSPPPDERREVFTIDARDEMLNGPKQKIQESDPAESAFNEARKRARRSTSGVPKTDFVSLVFKYKLSLLIGLVILCVFLFCLAGSPPQETTKSAL